MPFATVVNQINAALTVALTPPALSTDLSLKIVFPRRILQHRQIQRAHGTHPHRAVAVVHQVAVADRVDKHHQAVAVHRQPGNHVAEQGRFEGQLATPFGVRADGLFMHTAHLERKFLRRSFTQRARLRHRVGVEIDMGVKAVDRGSGGLSGHHGPHDGRTPAVCASTAHAAPNTQQALQPCAVWCFDAHPFAHKLHSLPLFLISKPLRIEDTRFSLLPTAGRVAGVVLLRLSLCPPRPTQPLVPALPPLKALFDGLDDMPRADPANRAEIEARAGAKGWPTLQAELALIDPATALRLSTGDSQYISRALEVHRVSAKPMSELHAIK